MGAICPELVTLCVLFLLRLRLLVDDRMPCCLIRCLPLLVRLLHPQDVVSWYADGWVLLQLNSAEELLPGLPWLCWLDPCLRFPVVLGCLLREGVWGCRHWLLLGRWAPGCSHTSSRVSSSIGWCLPHRLFRISFLCKPDFGFQSWCDLCCPAALILRSYSNWLLGGWLCALVFLDRWGRMGCPCYRHSCWGRIPI